METEGFRNLELSIIPDNPEYSIKNFKNFTVRMVMKDGNPTGICHIKSRIAASDNLIIGFIRSNMVNCEIDFVMQGFRVDYPIYISTKDLMQIEGMMDDMERVDFGLTEYLKTIK